MLRLPVLAFAILCVGSYVSAQTLDWKPYDVGGIPTSEGTYAVACDSGGAIYAVSHTLSVSSDEGHTWLTTAIGTGSYIAAGPHRGEAVVAGQNPIYTTDAGQHWLPLTSPDAEVFCAYGADGWLYTGSWSSLYAAASPTGPWQKIDGGLGQIQYVWIAPNGDLSVFAFSAKDTAIYRSSDHGATWRIGCRVSWPYPNYGVSEDDMGHIAINIGSDPTFVSSDFGASWSRSDSLIFYLRGRTVCVPRTNYYASITYAGVSKPFFGVPLCLTPAGTMLGQQVVSAAPYDTSYTYRLREYTPDFVFGRNDTDVFVTYHDDQTSISYGFPRVSPFDRCAVDSDGYFYKRSDGIGARVDVYDPTGAMKWKTLDAPPIFQLRGAPDGSVYASGSYGVLYHSTDRGWTWDDRTVASGRLLFFDISREGVFYAVNDSGIVYRSTDATTWSPIGTAPRNMSDLFATSTGLFALCTTQNNSAVFQSTDDGSTWAAMTTPLPVERFDVLPDGTPLVLTDDHVYIKRGASWRTIDDGLPPNLDRTSTALFSTIGHDMGGHLYIGQVRGGLYRSGITYHELGVPASTRGISRLSLYPNPATTSVTIEWKDAQSSVLLIDELGRLVRTERLTGGTATIDLRTLSKGVYQIEASAGGKPSFERLIVQ